MEKFSGYEEIEIKNFEKYETLELGGHVCKILRVKIETITPKTGNFKPWRQLIIDFDIAESDPQAGFYKRRYEKDVQKDVTTAKWKGVFKVNIPRDDGSEDDKKSKENFKRFITCIENSNNGYDWEKSNWDESTLVGKLFAGVFGIEEFLNNEGNVLYFTKCRFVRSVNQLEDITIPKVKLVDNNYMDYEEWLEAKQGKTSENIGTTVVEEDDDLPF